MRPSEFTLAELKGLFATVKDVTPPNDCHQAAIDAINKIEREIKHRERARNTLAASEDAQTVLRRIGRATQRMIDENKKRFPGKNV